ncbi:MAG: fluoride efflux transporter CrcB [Calditrichaeota bacterium]|nr:MAG: fluoride efflux transporter CrcB [Calditrichota bacterium]
MVKLLVIGVGGALGALLRYAVSGLSHRFFEGAFPVGTLVVNYLGCFLIGFAWVLLTQTTFGSNTRSFVLIGLLGAFTTFSTFGLESVNLFRDNEIKLAFANILLSNIGGLILVLAGFFAARILLNAFR